MDFWEEVTTIPGPTPEASEQHFKRARLIFLWYIQDPDIREGHIRAKQYPIKSPSLCSCHTVCLKRTGWKMKLNEKKKAENSTAEPLSVDQASKSMFWPKSKFWQERESSWQLHVLSRGNLNLLRRPRSLSRRVFEHFSEHLNRVHLQTEQA